MRWQMLRTHFLVGLIVTGCTHMCGKSREAMTPEDVVEAYLNVALNFDSVSQKTDLMEYATGELEASLAEATNETIAEAYIKKNYQLESFSVVERADRTPRETEITFQLAYREAPEGHNDFAGAALITTENTVSVIKEKQRWSIREVIGNKTTFDFPISELSRIRPGRPSEMGNDGEPSPAANEAN